MRAEIISVGTELLLGEIIDTNAVAASKALSAIGIDVYRRTTVGDNRARMADAFHSALRDNDLILVIGGLGPTHDDLTREVLAEVMQDELRQDDAIANKLREFFGSRGVRMAESNLKQALAPVRGSLLNNPNGTAPGLWFVNGEKIAVALPGPPGEFNPMLEHEVVPRLQAKSGGAKLHSRILRICGLGESLVEERIRDLMNEANPSVAPYAKTGEVHVRVAAKSTDLAEAERLVEDRIREIRRRLRRFVYGEGSEGLEHAVVRLLSARGLTLSAAESCTGGLFCGRITEVAGSSAVLLGGAVTYSNELKSDLVGVPNELIAQHGAVSEPVAIAMAEGARKRFGSDLAIGITGIAGPGGGSVEKPVGLVYIALAAAGSALCEKCNYLGRRHDIRMRSTQTALTMIRDFLLLQEEIPSTDG